MSIELLALAAVAFISLNALCSFNARFRAKFFGTIWKLRYVLIGLPVLYFLITAVLGASTTHSLMSALPQLVFTILESVIFVVLQFGIMFYMMGNSNRPEVTLPGDNSDLDWSDWIGSESVKDELQKAVESLQNWERYAESGTKPLNGMLLYGPPGTGKSLAAKVVAAKTNLPVVIASSGSLNGPFMGMGMLLVKGLGRRVRKLSRKYGGCVCFLDEIDAIGMSRGGVSGSGGQGGGFMPGMGMMGGGMGGNGTLQTLLTVMSGAESGETFGLKLRKRWGMAKKSKKVTWRILWMAATNVELSMLDDALTRPGRFGSLKLAVNEPNDQNRYDLFKLYLRKKNVGDDVDFDQLVQLSRGMTGAGIEEVCEAAMRTVIFSGSDRPLENEDLYQQIRINRFGLPRSVPLHESEKRGVAVHEAGHATNLVLYTPTGQKCSGSSIRPTDAYLGVVMRDKVEEISMMMEEDLYRTVLIAVGSVASEELVLHDRSAGVGSDLQQAMSTAVAMVQSLGMGDRLTANLAGGPPSGDVIRQAEDIVNATLRVSKRIVAANIQAVEDVAAALLEKIDLTGDEVIALVNRTGTQPFPLIKEAVKVELANIKAERQLEEQARRGGPAAPVVEVTAAIVAESGKSDKKSGKNSSGKKSDKSDKKSGKKGSSKKSDK